MTHMGACRSRRHRTTSERRRLYICIRFSCTFPLNRVLSHNELLLGVYTGLQIDNEKDKQITAGQIKSQIKRHCMYLSNRIPNRRVMSAHLIRLDS